MKVGIIGCGSNSHYHISFAKDYPNVEIVGVADKNIQKAKEVASKFNISKFFSTLKELVDHVKPEVIHIVTPPQTHFSLAKEAISMRCHVLIEKPMTLNLQEAEELYECAERYNVRLCTMHNLLFEPCLAKINGLVQQGKLGEITGIESYYGLDTRTPVFRDYPVPNVLPWIYALPGGPYQDFMPHPVYLMLNYTGKTQRIDVLKRSYGTLPHNLPDELRILIDGEKASGLLTLSFATQPHLHFLRIYGTKMTVESNIYTRSVIVHPLSQLPKAIQRATYNLSQSWQLLKSTTSNTFNLLIGRLKPYQGIKSIIHKFYDSINNNSSAPVKKSEVLAVVEVIDEINRQLSIKSFDFKPMVPQVPYVVKHKGKVLVTGATGFLGKRLVAFLVEKKYSVRILARKLSSIEPFKKLGAEIFFGDVADKESLRQALDGIDVVVHAAADTTGTEKDSRTGTIAGTRNILDLCKHGNIGKVVYISSCSVYWTSGYKQNAVVTEESPLEKFPSKRGYYSSSKLQAENFVREAMASNDFPITILRPGLIYGPGGKNLSPMLGFTILNKIFVFIGSGKLELPLIYIDNLTDAIIKSIQNNEANNQIFNVVDNEKISKRVYVRKLIKKLYPHYSVFSIPYFLLSGVTAIQEILLRLLRRKPFLTRYRLASSQKRIYFDNSKIAISLNWRPKVLFDEAVKSICNSVEKAEQGVL